MSTLFTIWERMIKDFDIDKYEERFLEYAENEDTFPTAERFESYIQRIKEYERDRATDK